MSNLKLIVTSKGPFFGKYH